MTKHRGGYASAYYKDFDIIIEYLNIQDQLEQYMLGFISSANGKFFMLKKSEREG